MELLKRIFNLKGNSNKDLKAIKSLPGYQEARKKMFNILYEYDTKK